MQKEFKQDYINNNNIDAVYNRLYDIYRTGESEEVLREIGTIFMAISEYKDSKRLATACFRKAKRIHNDGIYNRAHELFEKNDIASLKNAMYEFGKISSWRDSAKMIKECNYRINMLKRNGRVDKDTSKWGRRNEISDMHKMIFAGTVIAFLLTLSLWIWQIIPKY